MQGLGAAITAFEEVGGESRASLIPVITPLAFRHRCWTALAGRWSREINVPVRVGLNQKWIWDTHVSPSR